ncbi:MAG: helix-turn-helix domain-containing protein [Nitrososphaeraceae archaeon]|nr:helix-turn-helix domain-containing protein [Nitrososphaeraceae archaeon]
MYRVSKLNLTTAQKNSLKSLMKNTADKRHYRRLLAVLQKSSGRTFEDIAKELGVNIRTVQRWIPAYLEMGTKGLEIRKPGGTKSRITDENKEIMLSVLFNDPNIFGYIRNTWSLRSLAKCLTEELDIPVSFKHLQRILKDMGIRCKRPKLELEHGSDYEEGKRKVKNYKKVASALKKRR